MFGDLEKKEIKIKQLEAQYVVFGREICPDTKRPHLQCFVYFGEKKTFSVLKKWDGEAHWEASRGPPQKAAKYCKKDGDFWEKGTCPVMGSQTGRAVVAELVRTGASLKTVAEEHPEMYMVYHRGLKALRAELMAKPARTQMPDVYWVWGVTGVGKTKFATTLCESFYIKDETLWWDGYEGQDCIIIDDYSWDGKDESFRRLLRLCDRNKFQGQIKGGYVEVNSPKIVITCEYPPSYYWTENKLAQVKRRLHKELCLNSAPRDERPEVLDNTMLEPLDEGGVNVYTFWDDCKQYYTPPTPPNGGE